MNMDITFREAKLPDIASMHVVRMSVRENILSDPSLVQEEDYAAYIVEKGKGWIAESGGEIVGFCIVDLSDANVWALFVRPEFEGKGIGKRLQTLMLDWYFHHTMKPLRLSTDPSSRAAGFYRVNGWKQTGQKPNGEVIFEMVIDEYKTLNTI